MKKLIDKIIDFYKRNETELGNIFLFIIPVIIGVVGGTLGYIDKGFLGALAGFIRFGFCYYAGFAAVYSIGMLIYENWEPILSVLFLLLICLIIWFVYSKLNWLLTNY
jgi:hypothetical protein